MNVSVALAAYNGEKYIIEQCRSILKQLSNDDELIISINPSTDRTCELAEELSSKDHRVKVLYCEKKGILANFENAIRHCNNEIIFLSDQDDIWCENKVSEVLNVFFFNENIGAVVHGIQIVDEVLNYLNISVKRTYKWKITPIKIFIHNRLQGSCMAFKKRYLEKILPFPRSIPMHDSWIGMIIAHYSIIKFLDKELILYRRHQNTATKFRRRDVLQIIKSRLCLLFQYFNRVYLS